MGHGGDVCPLNSDKAGDQFTVVDSTGIFVHTVRWCRCNGAGDKDKHLQLLRCRLFPSTTMKPQTAFTFDVLDQFLIDELECKTLASSFYSKLRRLTNSTFPDSLPDRYWELMRVSRMWRDLNSRKRAGLGHDTEQNPGNGDLAIFCPACPQPGLNLPDGWATEYNSEIVALRYVVDGNFTAQHMKMRRPEDDVALSNGLAYMVANRPYQDHVMNAADNEERSSCQNHRAVNNANTSKTHLCATGVGATACVHHGCFVPHSVVDFYKGEQHKNVDYSICQAVSYKSQDMQRAIIIYDVACQWHKNFSTRINNCAALSWPEEMEITPAIGKFHLSAHKPYCFPRFSLMFLKGAGHVDGEILETLWASFNKISPSVRSMTLAHRQELYDDHMRDSNWKKLVGLVFVEKKHKIALEGVQVTKGPYTEFSASLDPNQLKAWTEMAERADSERGEALDIYTLQIDKAPSLAEMRLNLLEVGGSPSGKEGSVTWLIEGIGIEDAQDALRAEIRCLPRIPTAVQKADVAQKRRKLHARIMKFNESASLFATDTQLGDSSISPTNDPGFCNEEQGDPMDDDARERVFWGVEEDDLEDEENAPVESPLAEHLKLAMPSAWDIALLKDAGLEPLVKEEVQLRIGQANDRLEKLRTHLGHKSVLFWMNFQSSSSVRTDTRSKQDIRRVVLKINQDVRSYHHAREALIQLQASKDILQRYQPIKPEELGVSKDITEENQFGQSSDVLPWFWRIGDRISAPWNEESRARYERWREELEMVKHEMFWTTLWFKHHEHEWERRGSEARSPGHKAYAAKQKSVWEKFRQKAEESFGALMIVTSN
ncbi:hypothetical protein V8E55_010201 [Tylopilus felleus]